MKFFKKFIFVIFAGVIFSFSVNIVFAEDVFRQNVKIDIGSDFVANGRWTIPISPSSGSDYFWFKNFQNFGGTASMKYKALGIYNDANVPFKINDEGNDFVSILTGYSSNSIRNINLEYKVITPFSKPLAIYEFWLADGAYFFNPHLEINYPKNWEVISTWPKSVASDNGKIIIDYPSSSAYVWPVVVAFNPFEKDLSGIELKKEGIYYIQGDRQVVNKIQDAVKGLGFLDNLLKETIDSKLPEKVLIISKDLSSHDVSDYDGLAVRPNIIILNDEHVKLFSREELQTIIIHELVHLALFEKNLFNGAPYFAKLFSEGVPTFIQSLSLPYIVKGGKDDVTKYELASYGAGRFRFTPGQLETRYKRNFDHLFVEDDYFSGFSAYKHSALIMGYFHKKAGLDGMKKLFSMLEKESASVLCVECDSEKVLNRMSAVAKVSKDDLLYPARGSKNKLAELGDLIMEDNDAGMFTDVFADYVKNDIPKYFNNNGVMERAGLVPKKDVLEKKDDVLKSVPEEKKYEKKDLVQEVKNVNASSSLDKKEDSKGKNEEKLETPKVNNGSISNKKSWIKRFFSLFGF